MWADCSAKPNITYDVGLCRAQPALLANVNYGEVWNFHLIKVFPEVARHGAEVRLPEVEQRLSKDWQLWADCPAKPNIITYDVGLCRAQPALLANVNYGEVWNFHLIKVFPEVARHGAEVRLPEVEQRLSKD